MKKPLYFLFLFASSLLMLNACKKDKTDMPEFVKKHLEGKWPLKVRIETTYKDGVMINNNTITYPVAGSPEGTPVDTLLFTASGEYTKNGVTVNYNIDGTGENITFETSPESTWTIKYLRNTSISFSQERTEKIGSSTFTYYTEEQLIK